MKQLEPYHAPYISRNSYFQPSHDGIENLTVHSYLSIPIMNENGKLVVTIEIFNTTRSALAIAQWLDTLDDRYTSNPLTQYCHAIGTLLHASFHLPKDSPTTEIERIEYAISLLHLFAHVDRSHVYAVDASFQMLYLKFPSMSAVLPFGQGMVGTVATTQKSLVYLQTDHEPQWSTGMDHSDDILVRSAICIPLKSNQRLLGVLQLLQCSMGFTTSDLMVAKLLGQLIADALEVLQAHEAEEKARLQFQLLLKLSTIEWPVNALKSTFRTIETLAMEFLQADSATFLLCTPTSHLPGAFESIVLKTRRSVNLQRAQLEDGSIGPVLALPVLDATGHSLVGVLWAAHKTFNAPKPYFDTIDERLGQEIAHVLSLGLQNLSIARGKHSLVQTIVQMHSNDHSLADILEMVETSSSEALHAERVVVYLVRHAETPILVTHGGYIRDGLAMIVAETGQLLALSCGAHTHEGYNAAIDGNSVLSVPVLAHDNTVLAVLHAVNNTRPFQMDDIDTARAICLQLASIMTWRSLDVLCRDDDHSVELHKTTSDLLHASMITMTAAEVEPSPIAPSPIDPTDNLPPNIDLLQTITTWSYNAFNESKETLIAHFMMIFQGYHLHHHFHIGQHILKRFIVGVREQYRLVPYHNFLHAFTTLHMTFMIVLKQNERGLLERRDIFALYIGAMCHDMNHNGRTNDFHIKTRTATAMRYNDQSVLENMHAAHCFDTLRRPGHNVLENATSIDYMYIRKAIIRVILATDMNVHALMVKSMQERFHPDVYHLEIDNELLLNAIVHSADIANPTLPTSIHTRWSIALMEEFNSQYNEEIKLGISPNVYMSAKVDSIDHAKMNIGFIDGFCLPLWHLMNNFLDGLQPCLENIDLNRIYWQHKI